MLGAQNSSLFFAENRVPLKPPIIIQPKKQAPVNKESTIRIERYLYCNSCGITLGGNRLSPRQLSIVILLSKGKTNKEIANILKISLGTVKVYCTQIFDKLEIRNRTLLVVKYLNGDFNNFLHLPDCKYGNPTA